MRVIAVVLVLALAAHLVGTERLWRRVGRGRAVRGRHVASWAAGLLSIAVVVLTPLDALADRLLWAHMVQHLLLTLVAPVLLVAGRPGLPVGQLLGPRGRRYLHRWRLAPLPALGLAGLAHAVVVIGWHVPALYGAALAIPTVHAAEHATMLISAVLLWTALLRRDPRGRTGGAAALTAAVTGLLTGAVGVVLVFSPAVVYPWYAAATAGGGMSAADDQVVAGMLMWAVGGLAYTAATCLLAARWLRSLEDVAGRRLRRGLGAAGWLLAVVLMVGACTTRGTPVPTADVLRDAELGRDLVLEYGCVTCHDVPGVRAPSGRVGPPLAGFADRQTIAGTLPNTPENLIAWLDDPQAILPGNVMPDVGLSTEQARAVAAYLSTLD